MIVGIDLGTTNSAVAVWRDGRSELIPNRMGHRLTPSAVSLADDGSLMVGLGARERMASHPDRTVTAFKRYMGSKRVTKLGKHSLMPEELSALVLRSLKEDAEAYLGETVTEAVITVPAYFNDKQRKATRRAGEAAGFIVERLINEPTAAALAYGIHQLGEEARFLVFDLGGGTFDVSVVEIFEGIVEVRASTGDNQLGGEDFNEVLVQMMRERFSTELDPAGKDGHALTQKMRESAERVRRALSDGDSEMRMVWKDKDYALPLTQAEFEERAAPLMARLRDPVLRALRDADIPTSSLTDVILIGGSTRMPLVRRAVTKMFGRFPNATVNPDEAVAMGAAVQAGLKARDAALKEVVVTDVCPYSLGIAVARDLPGGGYEDGIFQPIIERSTVIPASRSHFFSTMQDNQRIVEVVVYQGEARMVSDNIEIGRMNVSVPGGPRGQAFEVRFSYDISGLLEVDTHVLKSGDKKQLTIVDSEDDGGRSTEESRAILAKLKVHPRDEEENRAATARGERCFANFLGDQRMIVEQLITSFNAALASQDPRVVDAARARFLADLDALEGQTFL